MNAIELEACKKSGTILASFSNEKCDQIELCKEWLKCNTCNNISTLNPETIESNIGTLINQARQEIKLIASDKDCYGPALKYFGFIIMYMALTKKMKPADIADNFNIQEIFSDYVVLHTQANHVTVEDILEYYAV